MRRARGARGARGRRRRSALAVAGRPRSRPQARRPALGAPLHGAELRARPRDGRTASVPGFNPVEAYEAAIANLAPELERRPRPERVGEVLEWAGSRSRRPRWRSSPQLDQRDARASWRGSRGRSRRARTSTGSSPEALRSGRGAGGRARGHRGGARPGERGLVRHERPRRALVRQARHGLQRPAHRPRRVRGRDVLPDARACRSASSGRASRPRSTTGRPSRRTSSCSRARAS